MGMSVHVVGFVPPDKKWKQMKQAYHSCKQAGIQISDEIENFFGYEEPNELGREVDIEEAIEKFQDSDRAEEGLIVDLAKLPKNVKFLRFYNSW